MKIAILNSLYPPEIVGGAELSVGTLSKALSQKGYDVVVITLSAQGKDEAPIIQEGIKVYRLRLENIFWYFSLEKRSTLKRILWHYKDTINIKMADKVSTILKHEKPRVFHTNSLIGFSVSVWQEAHKQHIRTVHTMRDYYLLCPRSAMYSKNSNCKNLCLDCRLFASLRIKATSDVQVVVGTSNFILNRHLNFGAFKSSQRQEVIYNAYDGNQNSTEPRQANLPIRFGFLGRLEPMKGIEFLLSAFSQIPSEHGELWVGGRGQSDYVNYLKREYPLINVHYLGFINPNDFFPQIDVLVQPSLWHEPFGRTIIEAYAYGRPVIISQSGGSPEIVDNGKTGYIFEADKPENLLQALNAFISQPTRLNDMLLNIKEKSCEFSVDKMLTSYIKVYDGI